VGVVRAGEPAMRALNIGVGCLSVVREVLEALWREPGVGRVGFEEGRL